VKISLDFVRRLWFRYGQPWVVSESRGLMKRQVHLICNAHLDPVWLWEWQEGAAEALSTFRVAAELCEKNQGFVSLSFFPKGGGRSVKPMVLLDNPAIELSALKQAASHADWIVRLFNTTGQKQSVRAEFPVLGARRTLRFAPFEIKTLRADAQGGVWPVNLMEAKQRRAAGNAGKSRSGALLSMLFAGMLALTGRTAGGDEFMTRPETMRRTVIEYGDRYYDNEAGLVRRTDDVFEGRINIAQHSPEYAAALLDAGERIDRANRIIGAMLDHQWLGDKGTWRYGNFIWWGDAKRPEDRNAVAFMTPWLCTYRIRHRNRLTEEIAARLDKALPLCLTAVRSHSGPVHYDNIWFLKAASLTMLGLALDQPGLLKEAETRLDEWIAYAAKHGINEFNSPTYAPVNIYALEFIWGHAPETSQTLREKTRQLLDFCYADLFMNWHPESGISAGTHSRAYPRERSTSYSLASVLAHRHTGHAIPHERMRSFEYNFVANDYPVPERIRAYALGISEPFELRASHPVWTFKDRRVERTLYRAAAFTLGTQTGYRATADQALPFKITYAGSPVEERASFIQPVPAHDGSRKQATIQFAHHQVGPRAIVLYEANQRGRQESAYLRLVIEPNEKGGMLHEILWNGKPYDRTRRELKSGDVIAWRVAETLVAIRLLDGWGVDAQEPNALAPAGYALAPTAEVGLCLHGLVCYRPKKPVAVNHLSCGFAIHLGTVKAFGRLAKLSEAAAQWAVTERRTDTTRDITWADGETTLRLVWDGAKSRVSRYTNGEDVGAFPRYESPLIRLQPGEEVGVLP